MRQSKNFFALMFLSLLGVGLAGCKTHTTVTALANGYEEVSHPHHTLLDEPEPPRISLQHRTGAGSVSHIWPSLYGVTAVVKDQLAIFVAEKAAIEPERITRPRLFAVTAPDLPLDITDEVLWRWSKLNGKDFGKSLAKFNLVTPAEKNGRLELLLDFMPENRLLGDDRDWPDKSVLAWSWDQVAEIIRNVKTKGVVEKDLRWHSRYLGEKF